MTDPTRATSHGAAEAPTEDAVAKGHVYDGIQEYDNPTPFWWNALFILTILFAPVYAMWFHSPYTANTHADRYQAALAANLRRQFGELGDLPQDGQTVMKYADDPDWLPVGEAAYATNCKQCHGAEGAGISGPNLTDDLYVHIKKPGDILDVINNGRANGAMPAWANRLHPNEVVLVSSYVASLRGKNLPGKSWPNEARIAPWPEGAAAGQPEREPDPPE